jgi:hypothetical protein
MYWGIYSSLPYQEIEEYYLNIFSQKWIDVVANDQMDIKIPHYVEPDVSQKNRNIDYRISLLPPYYQYEEEYFIFPKAWIVMPIVNVSPLDRVVMDQWKSVDYLHYMQRGAIHHRGVKPFEWPGNFTVAWHTAYYKSDPGDFKTNMQWILLADVGDVLLYVKRIGEYTFKRYVYTVNQSYETDTRDVSILLPSSKDTYEFTLYGCSPIGTTDKRWVVKSTIALEDTVKLTDNKYINHSFDLLVYHSIDQ